MLNKNFILDIINNVIFRYGELHACDYFYSEIAAFQGCVPFLNDCLEKVQTLKRCPVCTRGLDSQSDVETVIDIVR